MDRTEQSVMEVLVNPEYTPFSHKSKKETQRRATVPTPPLLLLVSLACILFGAAIPLLMGAAIPTAVLGGISIAVLAVCVLLLRYLCASFRAILPFVLILVGTLFLTGSVTLPALLAALCASASLFTYLCRVKPTPAFLLIPLLSYGIAFAVMRTPLLPAFSLVPLPAALMLYGAIRIRADRVSMICRAALGLAFSGVVALCIWYLLSYGTPTVAHIRELTDTARETLISSLSQQMLSVYREIGTQLHDTDLMALCRVLVNVTFNLLPAIAVLICLGLAHLMQGQLVNLLRALRSEDTEMKETLRNAMHFEISVPSAVIFLLCGVLMLIFSTAKNMQIPAAAAQNIFLILVPGLATVAILAMRMQLMRKGPSCFGSLLYILYLISLLYFTLPVLLGTAVAGAIVTVVRAIKQLRKTKA